MDIKSELSEQQTAIVTPSDFSFPFDPYDIQLQFMRKLFYAIETEKLGIFESPTGTGKSLSLICGSLRWLQEHEDKIRSAISTKICGIDRKLKILQENPSEDWLNDEAKKVDLQKSKFDLLNNLSAIDEVKAAIAKLKENKIKGINERNEVIFRNLSNTSNDNDDINTILDDDKLVLDCELLLEDCLTEKEQDFSEDLNDLRLQSYERQKLYFCSRTHSQLSQFISEIRKTSFKEDICLVPLASRQSYCINPKVRALKSLSLINDRCLELKKGKKTTRIDVDSKSVKKKKCSSGCPYYNQTGINKLKDEILCDVHDIEDLVKLGQRYKACPYYASRAALPLSQVVVLPYNTLLHKTTREASQINLKGQVVLIDEAHNLLDAIGNMYSSQITGKQLCQTASQLVQYRNKFEKLFSAQNLLHLNQLIFVVGQLILILGGKIGCSPADASAHVMDTKVFSLRDFMEVAAIDNYNIFELKIFWKNSKLAHKLQGFSEIYCSSANSTKPATAKSGIKSFLREISKPKKNLETEAPPDLTSRAANDSMESKNAIFPILSFLETLTNHYEDGRVVCCRKASVGQGTLKYMLLNPAAHFKDIVQDARSVIVAGGTMQPISEFKEQLFEAAGGSPSRVVHFSCCHVIPQENILPMVVCTGPSNKQLDFSYQSRNALPMINEMGRLLDNVCNVIPAGIVCFFTSYEYEDFVFQQLTKNGSINKIATKKKVFREPKKSNEVDKVLAEYSDVINKSKNRSEKPNGAILFSVIGGKLSEGLNFSDDLGRCVIVIGLPYPNIKSPELIEKMLFLDGKLGAGTGRTHYENLCMKAVNQSIGRAVRHKDDYAVVLLLDNRFQKSHVLDALPEWMRPSLVVQDKFGPAFSRISKFFASKKKIANE